LSALSLSKPRKTPGVWQIMLAAALWGTVGVTTQALYHLTATTAFSIGFFRLAFATPALALGCFGLMGRRMFWVAPDDRRHRVQTEKHAALTRWRGCAYRGR
jgi:DME family drug/metabolite transporter